MKHDRQANAKLCAALGLDANVVSDIQITIKGMDPARVSVTMLLDGAANDRLCTVVKDFLLIGMPAPDDPGKVSGYGDN